MIDKLGLTSDFRDYYDHAFDVPWSSVIPMLSRNMTDGRGKVEQLKYLRSQGARTPQVYRENPHNPTQFPGFSRPEYQFLQPPLNDNLVVLISDDVAHCGIGKDRVGYLEAAYGESTCPYMEYIEPAEPATSYRLLVVGARQFWLKYKSDHEWKSNVGEVDISLVVAVRPDCPRIYPKITEPLYAIDFVKGKDGILVGVDFNCSPGIKGTPVQDLLKPNEVYELIKDQIRNTERVVSP